MELARIGGTPPENYLTMIYTFKDIMSLVPVVCSFFWGFRALGLVGATLVGFVNATWAELIYFAPHTLTEVVAGNTFAFALYLAIIAKESVTVPASSFTRLTCFANGYRIRTNQLDEPVCIWLRRRTCAGDDAVSSD